MSYFSTSYFAPSYFKGLAPTMDETTPPTPPADPFETSANQAMADFLTKRSANLAAQLKLAEASAAFTAATGAAKDATDALKQSRDATVDLVDSAVTVQTVIDPK
jgi:hypothetical protein